MIVAVLFGKIGVSSGILQRLGRIAMLAPLVLFFGIPAYAITISSPADGSTVTGLVAIQASLQNTAVQSVNFLIDGAQVGSAQRQPSSNTFIYDWQSSSVTNGSHVISVATVASPPVTAQVTIQVQNVAPSIVSISPAQDATNVPVGSALSITFSAPMKSSSLNSSTITLSPTVSQVPVAFSKISYDSSSNTVTLTPGKDLKPGMTYTVIVSTGVTSTNGVQISKRKSYTFTTGSVTWNAGAYVMTKQDSFASITTGSQFLTSVNAPYIAGMTYSASWPTLESQEGSYDFSSIDSVLTVAKALHKKVSLSMSVYAVTGSMLPSWYTPTSTVGQQSQWYYFYDTNPNHQAYCSNPNAVPATSNCTLIAMPLPWDPVYLRLYSKVVSAMGQYYAQVRPDLLPVISYLGGQTGGASSAVTYGWGLPTRVFDSPTATAPSSWTSSQQQGGLGYQSQQVVSAAETLLDAWMRAFPALPEWDETGNLPFDPNGSFYVTDQLIQHGFQSYPDRYGIWREDLNAKRDSKAPPQTSNPMWITMSQYRPKTGAQMVWNVQDCPTTCRMDGPGTSKTDALQTAMSIGSSNVSPDGYYLMPYQEIYQVDVEDSTLLSVFQHIYNVVQWRSDTTPPTVPKGVSTTNQSTSIKVNWSASTDTWDKVDAHTDSLSPAPALTVIGSVGYHVYRNGVLVATTEQTSYTDSSVVVGNSYQYRISAFDAAGNESAQSSTSTMTH